MDQKWRSRFEYVLRQKYNREYLLIRESAHLLHAGVNQTYDGSLPYGFHLDMVADGVMRYADEVCCSEADVLPLYFGAYYHDSIEDARLTYHDVVRKAQEFLTDGPAHVAAEIVYALTNEKGRNRAERANEKYYRGIRQTPYAPFVKLADRLANATFSCRHDDGSNEGMRRIYRQELPHFLEAIRPETTDDRHFLLPQAMIDELCALYDPDE